jgi:MOSC domain-containing protein
MHNKVPTMSAPSPENAAQAAQIDSLYRYPVKGLTPERLTSTDIEAGDCVPFDRAYAIENGPGRFDPLSPRHLPKVNFLMLMRNERLATLRTSFDDASQTLTILRDGNQVAKGQLSTVIGRQLIEQFLSSYFSKELRGAPKIVHADGHSFSDVPMKCLHIVNLASVRELERVTGRTVDPLRFRANMYIDGIPPWQEFEWIGKTLEAGTAELNVITRTQRCDATNVDPSSAERDMSIPRALQRQWSHQDFGIYAKVAASGSVSERDGLSVKA